MTKRVLLVWETGGGEGHRLKLGWIGKALQDRGFETVFALRKVPPQSGGSSAWKVLPAPAWPLSANAGGRKKRPCSHADLLADLSIAQPGTLRTLIRDWEQLFADIQPAAIVADSAPAALAAARGRIPVVAVGNGFSLPPSDIGRFPDLEPTEETPATDQPAMLHAINEELRQSGRPQLETIGGLYAADRSCLGTFAEFDPYRGVRQVEYAAPWLPEWQQATPDREEIFVYLSIKSRFDRTILNALAIAAAGGLRVRLYAPRLDPASVEWLTSQRVRVEPAAVPLQKIQSQARLIVSLGSLGLASFAAAAGIPQFVIPWAFTTRRTGSTIQSLGIGRSVELSVGNPLEPSLLRQALREAFYDEQLTARAIERAPDFLARTTPSPAETTANFVSELA